MGARKQFTQALAECARVPILGPTRSGRQRLPPLKRELVRVDLARSTGILNTLNKPVVFPVLRIYFTSHTRKVLAAAGFVTLRIAVAPGFMTSSPVAVRRAGNRSVRSRKPWPS